MRDNEKGDWLAPAGTQSFVQAIGDHRGREHRKHQCRPRKNEEPPGDSKEPLRVVEHLSPGHQRRVAKSQEAEPRLRQNRAAHLGRGDNDNRRECVGERCAAA